MMSRKSLLSVFALVLVSILTAMPALAAPVDSADPVDSAGDAPAVPAAETAGPQAPAPAACAVASVLDLALEQSSCPGPSCAELDGQPCESNAVCYKGEPCINYPCFCPRTGVYVCA